MKIHFVDQVPDTWTPPVQAHCGSYVQDRDQVAGEESWPLVPASDQCRRCARRVDHGRSPKMKLRAIELLARQSDSVSSAAILEILSRAYE